MKIFKKVVDVLVDDYLQYCVSGGKSEITSSEG